MNEDVAHRLTECVQRTVERRGDEAHLVVRGLCDPGREIARFDFLEDVAHGVQRTRDPIDRSKDQHQHRSHHEGGERSRDQQRLPLGLLCGLGGLVERVGGDLELGDGVGERGVELGTGNAQLRHRCRIDRSLSDGAADGSPSTQVLVGECYQLIHLSPEGAVAVAAIAFGVGCGGGGERLADELKVSFQLGDAFGDSVDRR